jgi:hypothetical protein
MLTPRGRARRARRPRPQVAAVVAAVALMLSASSTILGRTLRGFPRFSLASGQGWIGWALLGLVVAGVAAAIVMIRARNDADGDRTHNEMDHSGETDDATDDCRGQRPVQLTILVAVIAAAFALAFGVFVYTVRR